MSTILATAFALLLLGFEAQSASVKAPFTPPSPSRLGKYPTAAVSSDAATCSDIGRDVLLEGGNAVDAAIATIFCVGVMNPHSSGVGGGFLMTIYDSKTRTARCLNAREVAPLAATEDMYGGDPAISARGPLAVAVPGEVAGSWAAYEAYGTLPWDRLIKPSADLAEFGITVTRALSLALRSSKDMLAANPSMDVFFNPKTGDVWKEGDVYTRQTFANTLRELSRGGGAIFYNGSIGNRLAADLQSVGSIIVKQDLTNYRPEWVDPVKVSLKNLDLYSIPPPGSGVLTAFMLNILESYLAEPNGVDLSEEPLTYHWIAEAFKHAYAQRTKLADPLYEPQVYELVKNLTSKAWTDAARGKINNSFTSNDPDYYGAVLYQPEDHGTAHISVLDANGMAVAVTSTVNLYFGAGFASETTGIILNDEMDDFASPGFPNEFGVEPSPANFIKPGKRPLSSMVPTVVARSDTGKVRLIVGAAGGTRITTSSAYTAIRNLWFGETIKEAIDSRRIHHQLLPMELVAEANFPRRVLDDLAARDHKVTSTSSAAVVNGISVENDGFIYANADHRKGGDVAGF